MWGTSLHYVMSPAPCPFSFFLKQTKFKKGNINFYNIFLILQASCVENESGIHKFMSIFIDIRYTLVTGKLIMSTKTKVIPMVILP